jgi:hypothetical protein
MPGVMLGAVREVRGPTPIDIACNPPLVESLDRRRFFFSLEEAARGTPKLNIESSHWNK